MRFTIMFAVVSTLLSAPACAGGAERKASATAPLCPLTLMTGRVGLPLTAVSLYDGPPSEGAELRPSGGWQRGTVELEEWAHLAHNVKGNWIDCRYGADGSRHVRRALAAGTRKCVVRYVARQGSAFVVSALHCTG